MDSATAFSAEGIESRSILRVFRGTMFGCGTKRNRGASRSDFEC
jgi:hypothetical protein